MRETKKCSATGCVETDEGDGTGLCPRHDPKSELYVPPAPLPDRPYYVLPGGRQVKDVVAHLDYNIGVAAAYLFRAGRKPGNDKADDLQKAIDHITFEIQRIGGK